MEREIAVIIDCDISDREIKKCEVDEQCIGSCGNRADYCMWANWKVKEVLMEEYL